MKDILPNRIELAQARTWRSGLGHALRLQGETSVNYAYRRQTCGPSSSATVELRFTPSREFTVERACPWPESVPATEQRALDAAVACGVLDGLGPLGESPYPVEGLAVVCTAVGWDEVGSSQMAFYAAAWHAARQLRQEARWDLVPCGQ